MEITGEDLKQFFSRSRHLMAVCDDGARLIAVNPAWLEATAMVLSEIRGEPLCHLVHEEDVRLVEGVLCRLEREATLDVRLRSRKGGALWVELSLFREERRARLYVTAVDISVRVGEEEALAAGEAFLERLHSSVPQAAFLYFVSEGRSVLLSQEGLSPLGYRCSRSLPVASILHPDDLPVVRALPERLAPLAEGQSTEVILRFRHRDGRYRTFLVRETPFRRDERGSVTQILAVAVDITDQKDREASALEQACRDDLTELMNRRALMATLHDFLEKGDPFALSYLDLDHFKEVNDSFGHGRGDALLRQIGRRLSESAGPGDVVARLGGDEFVVLMKKVADRRVAQAAAEGLKEAIETIRSSAEGISLSCSIGVALFPEDGRDGEALLAAADGALYRAKAAGRSCIR